MASINIRPLGDRVVVEPLEAKETTKSGLIIPDSAKEKPQEAAGRRWPRRRCERPPR